MALTDTAIRNAKVDSKPKKLSDAGGLFLLLNPNGSRWWRFKYRVAGKEKLLSLGTYPEVSLKEARDGRDEARAQLFAGRNPAAVRKARKIAANDRVANSFEAVAREWFDLTKSKWEAEYANLILHRLERDMFPSLGARPISEIAPPELLMALRRIERRGAIDTAYRALQKCGQIFRYAIVTGRATHDPAADLRGELKPKTTTHYASVTDPKAVGELMRAIRGYLGTFETQCALQLAILTLYVQANCGRLSGGSSSLALLNG